MTREEIMALSAEELRLAIAKAMGWTNEPHRNCSCGKMVWYDSNGCVRTNGVGYSLPDWPANIADAWELVEEMENAGYWVQIQTPFIDNDDPSIFKTPGYYCGATPKGVTGWNGRPDNWTRGDTAPLAICRAWLIWKQEAQP